MAIKQNILVTTDVLVFGKGEDKLTHLLLIQRKNEPFKGKWAFPGGFVEDEEDLNVAAVRELREETGLRVEARSLRQVGVWGAPDRDPRGRTVTIAFEVEVNMKDQEIAAADDAGDARWWSFDALPDLAFDHDEILKSALNES